VVTISQEQTHLTWNAPTPRRIELHNPRPIIICFEDVRLDMLFFVIFSPRLPLGCSFSLITRVIFTWCIVQLVFIYDVGQRIICIKETTSVVRFSASGRTSENEEQDVEQPHGALFLFVGAANHLISWFISLTNVVGGHRSIEISLSLLLWREVNHLESWKVERLRFCATTGNQYHL
jgi:hypothetical protein